MAKIKPEFDRRNVKVIGLSWSRGQPLEVGGRHRGDTGNAPTTRIIGDADFNVSKLYGCFRLGRGRIRPPARPPTIRTVRNVFVIGPDKKVKLIFVYR